MTQNFTYSQNYGTITVATFTDTSTDPDPLITGRLIYLRKSDGTYLVPEGTETDYIFWPAADSSISISGVLDKDYALEVTVLWFIGSSASYTKVILCLFRAYSELFLRKLTQAQAANPTLINNVNFYTNKGKLRDLVDDSIQAVAVINDQTIAQYCLDEAKKLTDNPQVFH